MFLIHSLLLISGLSLAAIAQVRLAESPEQPTIPFVLDAKPMDKCDDKSRAIGAQVLEDAKKLSATIRSDPSMQEDMVAVFGGVGDVKLKTAQAVDTFHLLLDKYRYLAENCPAPGIDFEKIKQRDCLSNLLHRNPAKYINILENDVPRNLAKIYKLREEIQDSITDQALLEGDLPSVKVELEFAGAGERDEALEKKLKLEYELAQVKQRIANLEKQLETEIKLRNNWIKIVKGTSKPL